MKITIAFFLSLSFMLLMTACGIDKDPNHSNEASSKKQKDSTTINSGEEIYFDDLEKAKANPAQVKELNLEGKALKTLPEEIFQFENLEVLYLGNNPELNWQEALQALQKSKKLKAISITQTSLKTIPEQIAQLKGLETIWLDLNPDLNFEQVFEVLAELPSLREISLRENSFEQLPANIQKLKNLEKLYISYNEAITELCPEIAQLSQLTIFEAINTPNLNANQSFGVLSKVQSLRTLIFTKNQLVAIPIEAKDLVQIEELWLEDNALTAIPDILGNIQGLKVLKLMNNPLELSEIQNAQKLLPKTKIIF